MSRRHGLIGASKPWLYKEEYAEFYYRQTSGGVIMNNSPLVGSIDRIKGQTIAWNQLVDTSTSSVTTISGHKYYTNVSGVKSIVTGDGSAISVNGGTDMLFDLTLIYGKGNEPSTPEEFEADYQRWFGKPLTYEPYDEGSLRNVQMEGIKSVGFNQWDEEWELGTLDSDGSAMSYLKSIRSKYNSPIRCLPLINYYVKCPFDLRIYYYDKDDTFIEKSALSHNATFTTPARCYYIRFGCTLNYDTIYNNDICINISDSSKNGTYEPYEEHEVSIPVTTLTGKLNGEGESVVIFPDGMKGVNDVKDEIYIEDGVTKAVKRVGRVDLGSLSWNYYNGNNQKMFYAANLPSALGVKTTTNLVCSKYVYHQYAGYESFNETIKTLNNRINVTDLTYTDANSFKSANQGVYLDYELAELQVYVLDTPLPIAYNCEAGGTEQILPEEIGTGIAPIMDIKYKIGQINN